MHDRVHDRGTESRGDRIRARGLHLRSLRHGVFGVADVVEFLRASKENPAAVCLPETTGYWLPRPVEYKRGRPKYGRCDELQLCAQALCLEEMLGVSIVSGDLYYGRTRRRNTVRFDENLRKKTGESISELHRLLASSALPAAEPGPKCKRCSLRDDCFPSVVNRACSAEKYVTTNLWGGSGRLSRASKASSVSRAKGTRE